MQLPFAFTVPKVEWKPKKLGDLPSWRDAKRICVDVETKDPDLRDRPGHKGLGPGNFRPGNHIVGIGFSIEDGETHYLPIRHEGGDNLDVNHTLNYVRDQARSFTGTIVGANLGYDLGFLEKDEVYFTNVSRYSDVINAAVVIYELFDRYGLDAIAEREGIPGKDETILREFATAYKVNPKRDLYKLPGRAVEAYAEQDVRVPLTLLRRQERQIDEAGLQKIWDLESAVLPILVKMRRRGVRINMDKVDRIDSWAYAQEEEQLAKVKHLTGVQINVGDVWKAEVMARALEAIGIKVPMTAGSAKSKPKSSITGAFLDTCGEAGVAMARARDVNKLRTTFCARTRRYAVNGRAHCVFHQLRNTKEGEGLGGEETKGARFGRFSSEHFNIQQEPARDDEFGPMWRDVYEPEPGSFWVCSDWSQQEPRIAVHYAELLGLTGAAAFANQYRTDPTTDCHQLLADETGIVRKIVKNYFNGCVYGMGEAKLCKAIGHPTEMKNIHGKIREVPGPAGQEIITRFKSRVPWVSLLTREAAKRAEKVGVVWTIGGRRCNFPKDRFGNVDWTHKAFSRIGQGGAADQMKATLVAADAAGIPIQLAVHDEFDYSCTSLKQALLLKELQMDTVKFNVPMLVDQEYGTSWGTCKKMNAGGREFLEENGFYDT